MTEQAWDAEASDGFFPEPTLPLEWYAPVWNVREEAGSMGNVQAGGRECALRNLKFHTTEVSAGGTEIQERSRMRDQLEEGGGKNGKKNTPTNTTPQLSSFSSMQVQMSSSTCPC